MIIALVVLGCLLVGMLGLELGFRWADGIPMFTLRNFVRDHVDLLKVNAHIDYHPLLGWTMTPHIRANDGTYTITTDEYGTRLPSPTHRPLPVGAILASGDSFTIGAEVSDGDSWPAILEHLVGTPVINAGAGAWGADQIVLRAEQLLDTARPSTVIISFLWHDIQRAEYRIYGGAHKPYYLVKDGALELRNHPVPRFKGNRDEVGWARANLGWSYLALCVAKDLRFSRWKFSRWTNSWDLQYKLAMPQGAGIEISCKLLTRLKAAADERKHRLMFLMQYGSNDFDVNAPHEIASRVVEGARAAGIETIDPWTKIKRIFDDDHERFLLLWVLQPDGKSLGHMSVEGNRFIAEEVAAALAAGPSTVVTRAASER